MIVEAGPLETAFRRYLDICYPPAKYSKQESDMLEEMIPALRDAYFSGAVRGVLITQNPDQAPDPMFDEMEAHLKSRIGLEGEDE